jgi:DNA-binding NarL/FixJ family response regulator
MTPIRVLVVEDHEPIFRSICSILLNSRFQVVAHAVDGVEAVRKSADLQPDVILLDIGLPQLSGIEAAKQIRKLCPHSKILFVSQQIDAAVVEMALGLGSGYVFKSCIQADLLPAIESAQNAHIAQKPVPYRFGFDHTNGILHSCFESFISKQELRSFYETAVKHVERLSPNSYVADVSAVTSTTVTTGTILEYAKMPPILPEQERHRFLVASHSAAFWLMRMFAVAVRPSRPNLHVVKKHEEAWAILNIAEPRFDPLPVLASD